MTQFKFFETTLKAEIQLIGKALFSGEEVKLRLLPAQSGEGIVFKKIVPSCEDVLIPASASSVLCANGRNTVLSNGEEGSVIGCVEHLMSAFFGCGLTNVLVEIRGSEVPIFDGSSKVFVDAILEAGIVNFEKEIEPLILTEPHYWSKGNVHVIALPSKLLRFSYTLSYEGHPLLNSQFFTLPANEKFHEMFCNEIAQARTFCLYEEAEQLLQSGMVKGGSLDSAVVIKGDQVINAEGLRYEDEMVRHKVLDMIGDLAMIGKPVLAHFIGIRSGHEANAELVKCISEGFDLPKLNNCQGVMA